MVRRIANQVHQQVSRLVRGNYMREPVWFKAVLDNPPLALPPKAPPNRTPYDQKPEASRKPYTTDPKPLPIYYIEDDIRRQFFRDHPFEAFRPTTLIEGDRIQDSNRIRGEVWTRLRQRGRNPSPEDAIHFALNLYQFHSMSLSEAYARAVAQFRALKSERHVAITFAVLEAEELGTQFLPGEIERSFEKEKQALSTWEKQEEKDEGALAARKRWKAIVEKKEGIDQWTKGEEYVRLWKEGIRPDYSPILADSRHDDEEADISLPPFNLLGL